MGPLSQLDRALKRRASNPKDGDENRQSPGKVAPGRTHRKAGCQCVTGFGSGPPIAPFIPSPTSTHTISSSCQCHSRPSVSTATKRNSPRSTGLGSVVGPSGSGRSDCHESPRVGRPPAECGVLGDTRLSTRTSCDTRAPAAFHISESASRGTTTQDTSRNCKNPTTPPIIYAVGATPGFGQCLRNFETQPAGQRKSDEKSSNPIGLRSPAVTLDSSVQTIEYCCAVSVSGI